MERSPIKIDFPSTTIKMCLAFSTLENEPNLEIRHVVSSTASKMTSRVCLEIHPTDHFPIYPKDHLRDTNLRNSSYVQ